MHRADPLPNPPALLRSRSSRWIRGRLALGAALGAVLALGVATPAAAHPGHGEEAAGGFGAGFLHPLTGWDHLAAIVVVGALAMLLPGRRAIWAVPAAWIGGAVTGGLLGLAGSEQRIAEVGIGLSVLALGALLAVGRLQERLVPVVLVGVGLGAAFHGYAHGAELPATGAAGYALGIVVGTAVLLVAGIAAGLGARRVPAARLAGGWLASAAGLAFVIGA